MVERSLCPAPAGLFILPAITSTILLPILALSSYGSTACTRPVLVVLALVGLRGPVMTVVITKGKDSRKVAIFQIKEFFGRINLSTTET